MALPFIFIAVAAAAAGLTGIGKSLKAVADTNKANKANKEANDIVNNAKNRLETARKKCKRDLNNLGKTKIRILDSSVNSFVRSFGKLKNVNFQNSAGLDEMSRLCIDRKDFEELKELGGFATSIVGGIGLGAFGGAMTAFGAYGAAGTFAAASTGTAIASLSGAAATNATLAFFGGGSLAAGGLGVAGGTMVLGGLVAGPALAIMGFVVGAKASAAKEEAFSNKAKAEKIAEELGLASDLCYAICHKCDLFISLLNKLDGYFKPLIAKMDEAIAEHGTDYRLFSQEQKQTTAAAASIAKAIKMVLDTPILDKNGDVTPESDRILKQIKPEEIAKGMLPNVTSSPKAKNNDSRELDLKEIITLCQYDVSSEYRYGLGGFSYARFYWYRLASYINSSYGMDCTIEEFKKIIPEFGENGKFDVFHISYGIECFIRHYQISLVIESCLIRHTTTLEEKDVDWDKLISKIYKIYGVSMAKWQFFHPGNNKPDLGCIITKIDSSGKDNYFTATRFSKLMQK